MHDAHGKYMSTLTSEKVFLPGEKIVWTARGGARFDGHVIRMTPQRVVIEVWIPDIPPLRSGYTHRASVRSENVELQS